MVVGFVWSSSYNASFSLVCSIATTLPGLGGCEVSVESWFLPGGALLVGALRRSSPDVLIVRMCCDCGPFATTYEPRIGTSAGALHDLSNIVGSGLRALIRFWGLEKSSSM